MKQYFIDGCFDGFHYGHVHALFQAKQLCNTLIAATHSDLEMSLYKNPPLFPYKDRVVLLNYCKYIDQVINEPVPYITSLETLYKYKCTHFLHSKENLLTKNNIDPLIQIKKADKYITYTPTNGISTSNLIYRIYLHQLKSDENVYNKDYIYLKYLFEKMKPNNINNTKQNIILKNDWDIFNVYHLKQVLKVKQQYPNHNLIFYVPEFSITSEKHPLIYNQYERAITLCAFTFVDSIIFDCINDTSSIIIEDQLNIIPNLYNKINSINELSCKLFKQIFLHDNYTTLKEIYIDSNIYQNILKTQYNNILTHLKNIKIKERDLIIFDIDEVCLNNLMYNNIIEDTHFNYKNGLNPIMENIKPLFEYIHDNNIKYGFITGRKNYIKNLTIENLKTVNLDNYCFLYTTPNDNQLEMSIFKEQCRIEIVEKHNYNIICCIGDQISDITGKYTGISFLIYNPFYKTF